MSLLSHLRRRARRSVSGALGFVALIRGLAPTFPYSRVLMLAMIVLLGFVGRYWAFGRFDVY